MLVLIEFLLKQMCFLHFIVLIIVMIYTIKFYVVVLIQILFVFTFSKCEQVISVSRLHFQCLCKYACSERIQLTTVLVYYIFAIPV